MGILKALIIRVAGPAQVSGPVLTHPPFPCWTMAAATLRWCHTLDYCTLKIKWACSVGHIFPQKSLPSAPSCPRTHKTVPHPKRPCPSSAPRPGDRGVLLLWLFFVELFCVLWTMLWWSSVGRVCAGASPPMWKKGKGVLSTSSESHLNVIQWCLWILALSGTYVWPAGARLWGLVLELPLSPTRSWGMPTYQIAAKRSCLGLSWGMCFGFRQTPRGCRERGKNPQALKSVIVCPLDRSDVLFYFICCFYHTPTWHTSQHQRTLLYCDIFKWKLHGSNSFLKSIHLAWQHLYVAGRRRRGESPTLCKTGALSKTLWWLFSKQAPLLEWQRGRLHI